MLTYVCMYVHTHVALNSVEICRVNNANVVEYKKENLLFV